MLPFLGSGTVVFVGSHDYSFSDRVQMTLLLMAPGSGGSRAVGSTVWRITTMTEAPSEVTNNPDGRLDR